MAKGKQAAVERPALTPRQQRFVEEYLVDLNQTQAAIRCGYSPKTAKQQGSRLLTNANVEAAIVEAQAKRSERTGITQDRVLAEFARLGFADIRRLMEWSEESVAFKPSSELTDAEAAAIASVESETTVRTFEGGETEKKIKLRIKLWDKQAALTQIGRHLGMFKDRLEHSGDGFVLWAGEKPQTTEEWSARFGKGASA